MPFPSLQTNETEDLEHIVSDMLAVRRINVSIWHVVHCSDSDAALDPILYQDITTSLPLILNVWPAAVGIG